MGASGGGIERAWRVSPGPGIFDVRAGAQAPPLWMVHMLWAMET